ncbi:MAG TPA: DUF1501 domain-containing protein [Burkholderiaceae bacterium]
MSLNKITRREFLRKSALLSAALGTAGPLALNMAVMGEAAAQTASDYKALVCIFLVGGNDYGNTLIPYDPTNYNAYAQIRGQIAYRQSALAGTVLRPKLALPDARQMALAPELAPLGALFNAGKLGVLLNIGPLLQPTTLAQYNANSVPLPPKLFSHIDQQTYWQSLSQQAGADGWGGRIGDLMLSGNGGSMFTGISVNGNALLLSGANEAQFDIAATGTVNLRETGQPLFGSSACSQALVSLTTQSRANVLENALTRMMQRSIAGNQQITSALKGVPALTTAFDLTNTLAAQLQMVAKLIAARSALGVKRQVFFVSLGGFDTHTNLNEVHPGLLSKLAGAMNSFYNATVELGVANQVASFTASEFGRTLSPNGDGSDHGWGSHHFVMGGAIQGQNFYGSLPATAVNGPDDVGQGRLLPSTAIDQLAAPLASWFGVSGAEMATVLPNGGKFNLNALNLFSPA